MNRRSFLLSSLCATGAPALAAAQETPGVGVIFIGASWCTFCKSAAPVLAAMTQPAGIPVLVASHDARPIPPFAEVTDARTHPVAAQITEFPTTLIYSRAAGNITGQITGFRNARHYAQSVRAAVLAAARRTG
ncbi:conjugal transfer protein TraF [Leisingera sp. ANG-Vp]|uniref:conjugal transfer protein TraF n=1 Tax=Leisingera sp. ANG-Vp TaxID=1577896 RepID=UPI00057E73B1|nr:conjugal transfer protein TraF [Leisingera sp. ANG-Vp]KIC21345.1 hypothetical protein RA20_04920 [Leisingera sp. ANG-Vp]